VPRTINEYIHRTPERVQTQFLFDHHAQPINRFPEVDRLPAKIDLIDLTARMHYRTPRMACPSAANHSGAGNDGMVSVIPDSNNAQSFGYPIGLPSICKATNLPAWTAAL